MTSQLNYVAARQKLAENIRTAERTRLAYSDQTHAGTRWADDVAVVDFDELSNLYRLAQLGDKPPEALATVFANSAFVCFAYEGQALVGAGRALADGRDCAYIADVAIHPNHQRRGLGSTLIRRIVARCSRHKKIILHAKPGTERFYAMLGFLPIETAMGMKWDPRTTSEPGRLTTAPAPRAATPADYDR